MFKELTSLGSHSLMANIFHELCILMSHKYKINLKSISLLSSVLSKEDATIFLLKLRKLNKLDPACRLVTEKRENIEKLIFSQNNIDNADTHPIGSDLSIDLYANAAQNVLNIKHLNPVQQLLKKNDNSNGMKSYGNDEKNIYLANFKDFVNNILQMSSDKVVPNINATILHSITNNKS